MLKHNNHNFHCFILSSCVLDLEWYLRLFCYCRHQRWFEWRRITLIHSVQMFMHMVLFYMSCSVEHYLIPISATEIRLALSWHVWHNFSRFQVTRSQVQINQNLCQLFYPFYLQIICFILIHYFLTSFIVADPFHGRKWIPTTRSEKVESWDTKMYETSDRALYQKEKRRTTFISRGICVTGFLRVWRF